MFAVAMKLAESARLSQWFVEKSRKSWHQDHAITWDRTVWSCPVPYKQKNPNLENLYCTGTVLDRPTFLHSIPGQRVGKIHGCEVFASCSNCNYLEPYSGNYSLTIRVGSVGHKIFQVLMEYI